MPKRINNDYDIGAAFAAIEDELIASMIRNMKRHKIEEVKEDKQWSMWQAEQLKALEKYRKVNQKKFGKQFSILNGQIDGLIRTSRDEGEMNQEVAILNAIKKGFPAKKISSGAVAEFFKLNERKLDALINATTHDMQRAETAVLRMANDQYRKVIYNAQVYANSGAGTYEKAVDMATKDMLSAGLNCVEYKNGARHTLSDYADMAIRTANKRAYLTGEGEKRQEWGISTVIMNKRGNPCPKCLPWVGKVLIDDVWSGGKTSDGPYPLMSTAIASGLYHPRCKDSHTTYFPGISTTNDTWTPDELREIEQENLIEAQQQYAVRQAEKFERLTKYSMDEDNKREYARKSKEWNITASKTHPSYDELENYLKKKYNASMDDDVRALNLRQVNQTLAEFEQVMNDFPSIKENFTGINTAYMGKAGFVPNGELAFNPDRYKKLDSRLIGIGFHESGHLMELSLIKKYNPSADIDTVCDLYDEGIYAKSVVKKAYNRIGTNKTLRELREDISNYALKNRSETLSEAVADYYMNGNNASALSRQIMKVLKEELG